MPALPVPDPPLADDLVRLRPWVEADVHLAFRATQDALIQHFTQVPENQSEADLRRFVASREPARRAGEALTLVIADAGSDDLLGVIALLRFEWAQRRGEIGYWVARWARGRGVATRATHMLSRWALRELGLARLALQADTDNDASQTVAERCGFVREGVLRSVEERKGVRRDMVVFSLLPEDLR
jgi:RimJ/RimL family protein N-acetyltransferase